MHRVSQNCAKVVINLLVEVVVCGLFMFCGHDVHLAELFAHFDRFVDSIQFAPFHRVFSYALMLLDKDLFLDFFGEYLPYLVLCAQFRLKIPLVDGLELLDLLLLLEIATSAKVKFIEHDV